MSEGSSDHIVAAVKAAAVAMIVTPLLSWPTYFAVSGERLFDGGRPSDDSIAIMIGVVLYSMIITGIGILLVALPLTALGFWLSRGSAFVVALTDLGAAAVLCWFCFSDSRMGSGGEMFGIPLAYAAVIFVGFYLFDLKQRRMKSEEPSHV